MKIRVHGQVLTVLEYEQPDTDYICERLHIVQEDKLLAALVDPEKLGTISIGKTLPTEIVQQRQAAYYDALAHGEWPPATEKTDEVEPEANPFSYLYDPVKEAEQKFLHDLFGCDHPINFEPGDEE